MNRFMASFQPTLQIQARSRKYQLHTRVPIYIYMYTYIFIIIYLSIIINNSHYKIKSYPFLSIFLRPSHPAVNKCMAIASEALCSSILTAPPSRRWGNSRRRPSTSIGRKAPGRIAKPTWTIKQGYPQKKPGNCVILVVTKQQNQSSLQTRPVAVAIVHFRQLMHL